MKINLGMTVDITRPDKEQADRIEEALLLQKSTGLGVAKQYMERHGVAAETLLRVVLSTQHRRVARHSERKLGHVELALDEALAEGLAIKKLNGSSWPYPVDGRQGSILLERKVHELSRWTKAAPKRS